jgi:glyoxylase-like metal-dependent hydrolase (beta-lactamase superfamily II)
MLRWQVGEVSISRILELEFGPVAGPDFAFPDATPEAVSHISWLRRPFADEAGRLYFSFHALLLETPHLRILVDTCFGNDKQRGIPNVDGLQTRFLEEFASTGITPEKIDIVVCTHMHIDHVGWNTRLVAGQWVPTFPKARTLLGRQEFEHWKDQQDDPLHRLVFADSIQPLWDAGLIDLVETDHRICPEISLESTPGHTPGHVSIRIRSRGEEALITGDSIHHPMQFARPEWCIKVDHDPAESVATRKRLLADCAARDVLMIGTHFMYPTAVRVRRDSAVFRPHIDEPSENRGQPEPPANT